MPIGECHTELNPGDELRISPSLGYRVELSEINRSYSRGMEVKKPYYIESEDSDTHASKGYAAPSLDSVP